MTTRCWFSAYLSREQPSEEISDRSDLQPAVTLWPTPQVPQFLLVSEQPSDTKIVDFN